MGYRKDKKYKEAMGQVTHAVVYVRDCIKADPIMGRELARLHHEEILKKEESCQHQAQA